MVSSRFKKISVAQNGLCCYGVATDADQSKCRKLFSNFTLYFGIAVSIGVYKYKGELGKFDNCLFLHTRTMHIATLVILLLRFKGHLGQLNVLHIEGVLFLFDLSIC